MIVLKCIKIHHSNYIRKVIVNELMTFLIFYFQNPTNIS